MSRYYRYLLLILVNILMIQGCSVFKKTLKEKKPATTKTLWIKKIDIYTCDKNKKIGKLDIRYIQDSVMVIIVRNNAGMEGGRLYLYRDSVFIFNRIKKKYYLSAMVDGAYGRELKNIGEVMRQEGGKSNEKKINIPEIHTLVLIDIKKFMEGKKGMYVPQEFRGKIVRKNGRYCIYGYSGQILLDREIPVTLIKYKGRYKRVGKIDDIM